MTFVGKAPDPFSQDKLKDYTYNVQIGKRGMFGLGNRKITLKIESDGRPGQTTMTFKTSRDFLKHLRSKLPEGEEARRMHIDNIMKAMDHAFSNLSVRPGTKEHDKLAEEYRKIKHICNLLSPPMPGTKMEQG